VGDVREGNIREKWRACGGCGREVRKMNGKLLKVK